MSDTARNSRMPHRPCLHLPYYSTPRCLRCEVDSRTLPTFVPLLEHHVFFWFCSAMARCLVLTIIISLSITLIDLAVQQTPRSHWPTVTPYKSPLQREFDLGRRRRVIWSSNDRWSRRKWRRYVERAALAQAKRIAEAGCQRRRASGGSRRSPRGLCGRSRRLSARIELCPTRALAVCF
jgi:hypothetical protein